MPAQQLSTLNSMTLCPHELFSLFSYDAMMITEMSNRIANYSLTSDFHLSVESYSGLLWVCITKLSDLFKNTIATFMPDQK